MSNLLQLTVIIVWPGATAEERLEAIRLILIHCPSADMSGAMLDITEGKNVVRIAVSGVLVWGKGSNWIEDGCAYMQNKYGDAWITEKFEFGPEDADLLRREAIAKLNATDLRVLGVTL